VHSSRVRLGGKTPVVNPWYCLPLSEPDYAGGAMKLVVFLIAFVLTAIN